MDLPEHVEPWEPVTRYLNSSQMYRKADNSVKSRAFEPTGPSLSVFRIHRLSDSQIWDIGREVMRASTNPNLHGRADITVSVIQRQGLRIVADNAPERHASVTDWPDKETAKSVAQELAAAAALHLL